MTRLDYYDILPKGMDAYLASHGHHFSKPMYEWAVSAGIDKHVTFHCARHTFAIMLVERDVDAFVLQELLGHSSIRTTQVYVKVADKKRREAALRLPQILPET